MKSAVFIIGIIISVIGWVMFSITSLLLMTSWFGFWGAILTIILLPLVIGLVFKLSTSLILLPWLPFAIIVVITLFVIYMYIPANIATYCLMGVGGITLVASFDDKKVNK